MLSALALAAWFCDFFPLLPQSLTVGAQPPDFRAHRLNLKAEIFFNLLAHRAEWLTEIFFHAAALHTDDVGVLLLQAGFVEVLVAAIMHQIQLIHQTAFLEELQRSVDSNTVQFWISFLGKPVELLRIEVRTGLVNDVEQDLPLLGEADAPLP